MIPEVLLATTLAMGPTAQTVQQAAQLPPAQEQYRDCVIKRESNHNPRARNPRSSAAGLYQFLDSKWRHGLAHMVTQRLKAHGMEPRSAKSLRSALRKQPIHLWHPDYQHVGFAAVLNAKGPWSGVPHWRAVGSSCDRLVRR